MVVVEKPIALSISVPIQRWIVLANPTLLKRIINENAMESIFFNSLKVRNKWVRVWILNIQMN
jgi:hypothetical protein